MCTVLVCLHGVSVWCLFGVCLHGARSPAATPPALGRFPEPGSCGPSLISPLQPQRCGSEMRGAGRGGRRGVSSLLCHACKGRQEAVRCIRRMRSKPPGVGALCCKQPRSAVLTRGLCAHPVGWKNKQNTLSLRGFLWALGRCDLISLKEVKTASFCTQRWESAGSRVHSNSAVVFLY